ncbi:MAG: flagellar hook assembly protein FlgD [Bryobacteraceae bacterium]
MATSINPIGTNLAESGTPQTTRPAGAPDVNKDMFLQLLVAQVRHQNPLQPADGIEFLSQLATFTSMEQMFAIREELAGIREALSTTGDSSTNSAVAP